MKFSILWTFITMTLCHPRLLTSRKDYILVLSHMRSYSSLLTHILGSHNEISGYAEMQQPYDRLYSLITLRYKVHRTNHDQLNGRFVLDKLLHNQYTVSQAILNKDNVHVVFLLRKPKDTLKSIINLGIRRKNDRFKNPERALAYYVNRVEHLKICAVKMRKMGLFIEAEKLISDTELVLEFLTQQLKLCHELEPHYSIFKYTGVPFYGDPSDRIKEGRVIDQKSNYSDVHLPPDVLKRAQVAYQDCRNVLKDQCISLDDRH